MAKLKSVKSVDVDPEKQTGIIAVDVGTKENVITGGYNRYFYGGSVGTRLGNFEGISREQAQRLEAQRQAEEQKKAAEERARQEAAGQEAAEQKRISESRAREIAAERLEKYKSSPSYIAEQRRLERELDIASGKRTIGGKEITPTGNVTIPISDGAAVSSLISPVEVSDESSIFSFIGSKFKKAKEQISASKERDIRQKQIERETPFRELNLPAKIRRVAYIGGEKLFEMSDIIRTKTIGGEPATPYEKQFGGEIVGETGLFLGFAPALTTTAEVTKSAQIDKIVFKGAKQMEEGGVVKTGLRFMTKEGEKGTAFGLTKRVKNVGEKQISKTIGIGVKGRTILKVPSTKPIQFKPTKQFAGVELTVSKDVMVPREIIKGVVKEEKGFVQVGVGKVVEPRGVKLYSKGKLVPKISQQSFISKAVGITDREYTQMVSETITSEGGALSVGVIKDLDKFVSKNVGFMGGTGKTISKGSGIISKEALTSTKNIVKATSIKSPKLAIKVIPSPSLLKVKKTKSSQPTKEIDLQKSINRISVDIEKELNKTKSRLNVRAALRSSQSQRQKQQQKLKQEQEQRQQQKLKQEQKLKQRQKLNLRLLRRFPIRTGVGFALPSVRTFKRRVPPPIMRFSKGQLKDPMEDLKKDSKDYLFYTEDFTARATGLKPQKLSEKDLLKAATDISVGAKIRRAPIVIPSLEKTKRKKRRKFRFGID